MTETVQGIILKYIQFQDNIRIVTIFTEKFGKRSFMLYFSNSKKSLNKIKIIQPLYWVDLTFRYKPNFKLQKIKEIVLHTPYESIPYSVKKTSIAFLLAEVLNKVIIEQYYDKQLFDFITNSLMFLDMNDSGTENFHLVFLAKLSRFLGFMPHDNFSEQNKFFSLKEGEFISRFDNSETLNNSSSERFHFLLNTDFDQMINLKLNRQQRQNLLEGILKFYGYHIENFLPIKSAEVLHTVFDSD